MQRVLGQLKQGLEKGFEVAKEVVEDASTLLSQSRVLQNYKLGPPVATCGPGEPGIWAIYSGTSKKPGAVVKDVAIWVLDKRRLVDAHKAAMAQRGGGARAFEAVFDAQRRGCQHLARLKHPGVVKVIEPLEDSAGQMVLVTEAVWGSLHNVMTRFAGLPSAAQGSAEHREAAISGLEARAGLVGVADTLAFLHGEAGLAHCGLSPQVIMITAEGAWKLAGFSFAVATDYAAPASSTSHAGGGAVQYTYNEAFPPPWEELSKPSLPYTAPELVGGWGGTANATVSPATDVFSLACIAYELLVSYASSTNQPGGTPASPSTSTSSWQLLPVRSNANEYRTRLAALTSPSSPLNGVPATLQGVLRTMLAPAPTSRPSAAAFASAPFFQEDVLLRGLKFLDTILQREAGQKAAFLRDLATFWCQYDDRTLRLRVLPPLIRELRSEVLVGGVVPLLLAALDRFTPQQFAASLLPALQPVMEGASGELLSALVKGSNALAKVMTGDAVVACLVPLYARALDPATSPPGTAEDALRALAGLAASLDYGSLKNVLLPRVRDLCCRTTSAAVRVLALGVMGVAGARLDRVDGDASIDTVAQVVGVDRSAATLMAAAGVADALSRAHGAEMTATRLLPLLCPLLLAPSLAPRQFRDLMGVVQGMLERIAAKVEPEAARAGSGSAAGASTGSHTSAGGANGAGSGAAGSGLASWDTPVDAPTSHKSHKPPTAAPTASHASTALPAWSMALPPSAAAAHQPPSVPQFSSAAPGLYGRAPGQTLSQPASQSLAGHGAGTGSSSIAGSGWGLGGGIAPSSTAAGGGGGDLFGGLSVSGPTAPTTTMPATTSTINYQQGSWALGGGGLSNGLGGAGTGAVHMPMGNGSMGGGGHGMGGGLAGASSMGLGGAAMKPAAVPGAASSTGSDPFSSLTSIAMSLPPAPRPPPQPAPAAADPFGGFVGSSSTTTSSTPSNMGWGGLGGGSSISSIAPPPASAPVRPPVPHLAPPPSAKTHVGNVSGGKGTSGGGAVTSIDLLL
mmetsp:Transcript_22910/g.58463  ORF Transcript_22910/g.58463 Transcript_22910/m.58463 type:complete len:1024 (-) Transcript_22910:213-3284(-)|eukprot:CAMPEP_0202878354 /NCGR_PEP_ID=MMETSP1391-20130828/32054_1 /ASSEMBLY_ACC=CAM_ASM_000867 /TAXON_ID=1034604 /ORGANISM="Chlamydomonas leiostraca, Strain SAG 11-49" /LENGTH=1023 /DNA_ID=CAMNT_0049560531 /DNA_START=98 /DNA_END=3169 /DNA_ORIENTATION=+